ncbi:DNA-binding helix-turn-helix protein [Leptospira kirschneri str. 2008720114]|uniref:helix-turn-helix domain-containing protein n=1 Tax=Leptospira kirschneri TaxID=29507 RepID=UPI0002978492|nr:helix-turn-helix domain-containing protein [Leptospira kirschneri]EKP03597.1 DNA-binding helix-turn-helix protein [Leptospira kirschneri str. 2008720114]
MEGIYLRTPKAFTKERRIKRNQLGTAILVFGSMWSFSGKGNVCFASIGLGPDDEENPKIRKATICSRSGLSKNTVVKYKKLLAQLGWIQVRREGGTKNDTIHLFETPQTILEKVIPNNDDSNDEKKENVALNEGTLGIKNPNYMDKDSCSVPNEMGFTVQNSSKYNINKIDTVKYESFQIETIKMDSIWTNFLFWARKNLSYSSLDTISSLKKEFQGTTLKILDPVSKSTSKIIEKYFSETSTFKIKVFFSKTMEDSVSESKLLSSELKESKPKQEGPQKLNEEEIQDIINMLNKIAGRNVA